MKPLQTTFSDRNALIEHVASLAPWATGSASPIQGGEAAAEHHLRAIDPIEYGKTRNYGDGRITRLSPICITGLSI
ncbi:MAG: hypothetical protein RI946_2202 [Pseudomonadota bacterium]